MTKQEMLAEVEAKIRKDIPRLMELSEGCKFHSGYGVETIVCIKGNKENVFIFKDLFSNVYETNEIPQHYKIIGHDIMLNDVLEWSLMNKLFNIELIHKTLRMKPFKNLLHLNDYGRWGLSKPLLKDQPEEVIKFLYNVKK